MTSLGMIFDRKLFCVFQAAQAMCAGDQTQLITELERQLATANEELCKKEEKIQVKYGWKFYLYKQFIYHNLILCFLKYMSDLFVKNGLVFMHLISFSNFLLLLSCIYFQLHILSILFVSCPFFNRPLHFCLFHTFLQSSLTFPSVSYVSVCFKPFFKHRIPFCMFYAFF